jgi:hypothetical protein
MTNQFYKFALFVQKRPQTEIIKTSAIVALTLIKVTVNGNWQNLECKDRYISVKVEF